MKTKLLHIMILLLLITGAMTPMPAQAKAAKPAVASEGISPAGMLKVDGTLSLDGNFNGALDLSGYSVEIDPVRGPVFGAERSAQSAVTTGNWAGVGDGGGVMDGIVRAILVDGTNVYVGGDFTDLGNNPAADYIAKWDGTSWSALGANSSGDGALGNGVSSLAMSGTDLYAGGSFGAIYNGGTYLGTATYIAKWDTLTGNWSALGSNGAGGGSLNGAVTKIAVSGSNVYVAGSFTNVNNGGTVLSAADYVAKWDGTNWSALGSNGAGDGSLGSGTYIGALAISGADVYVGGSFTDVNNGGTVLTAADRVAKWDGTNWSALGGNGAGEGSISGTVYSLAVSGANVYVGGQFTDVNNNGSVITTADYLAKWDGTNWSAIGSNGAGNGSLNNYPRTLFINGTEIYAGGSFTNVNNSGTLIPEADYLAKWDGSNWSAIGSNGAGDGAITSKGGPFIFALAMQGSNLLAGGLFYDLNNGGAVLPQADHLAQWDGANWSSLGTDANGALVGGYANNWVKAIAVIGTDVYVGGQFTNISNHGVNLPEGDNIAKWDGANWSALGSNGAGNGSLQLDVYALAVSGTDLYAGGRFSNVNNNGTSLPTADYVAKWDTLTNTWSALGSNGAGNGSLPASGYVNALAVSGGDLYVGGQFTNVNNGGTLIPEADYLAKWDGANWSALGSNGAGDGALNAQVSALAFGNLGELYVGGIFTNAAAIPEADYLAKWNAGSWSALGSNGAVDGALNNGVIALAVNGASVYAGGVFTDVNNGGTTLSAADYIAKWDGANWSALGAGANGSLNSTVRAIAVNGSDVYVGGSFTNVENSGTSADRIVKWNGASWSALGSNGAGNGSISGNNDIVYTLFVNGADLLVGGQFSNVNNNGTVLKEADYLAAYGISAPPIFADVPFSYWANSYIERLYNAGITGGCSTNPLNYCPINSVTRAQMAIFLLRGIHGSGYTPPAATGTMFNDVSANAFAAAWIEQLATEGITSGCGNNNFCPNSPVTRASMAVFLVRAKHGIAFIPPTATGVFTDVPVGSFGVDFIEQLAADGITSGCGAGNYCPGTSVKRDSMAIFLVRTFNLP